MTRTIRIIALALALGFSATAFAETTTTPNPCENIAETTRDMDTTQVYNLLASCRPEKAASVVAKLSDPVAANQWADAAKGFGQALGTAAKELGIAANDFLNSPAGYLLAGILIFNYAGGAVIGLPFTIFSMFFWWYITRRSMLQSKEYVTVPMFWGMFTMRRVVKTFYKFDDSVWVISIGSAVILFFTNLMIWSAVT